MRNLVLPGVSALLLLAAQAQAQQPVPVPRDPVAVENTNSAFKPVQGDTPVASPARPTVTAPAHIPPTGYLQFEQGFNQANGSPDGTARQFALSQTTKIALTTRLLLQFVTQPFDTSRVEPLMPPAPPYTTNDAGDLNVGAQYIVHKSVGPVPVVALGYIRRVRLGSAPSLDVGESAQSALLLLSGDVGKFHYDSNLGLLENDGGRVRRAQYLQSLAISHALFEKALGGRLGGVAEISHYTQPLPHTTSAGEPVTSANTAGLLFAAVYSVRPNLVLDWAFDHGLTSSSTQWQGSFGFTYLLPHRLWPDRHPVPKAVGPYRYRNSR